MNDGHSKSGFTLIELMIGVALVASLSVLLISLEMRTHQFSSWITAQTDMRAESRNAAEAIRSELRQAAAASLSPLPASSVSYRVPIDGDGNGTALDRLGQIELSTPRTICRDIDDKNEDGRTERQLILIVDNRIRVLANDLEPDEDLNGNGQLDEGEDRNGDGTLDRGLWFSSDGGALNIVVQSGSKKGPARAAHAESRVVVAPRN